MKKRGLIMTLLVAVAQMSATAEEATPVLVAEIRPLGSTCLESRKWQEGFLTSEHENCFGVGWGFASNRRSQQATVELKPARIGFGFRYRYSVLDEVEVFRLSSGTFKVVYRRKL